MPDTIDLPGIGPTKAAYVYGVGLVVAGVVGYAWWSRRNIAPADAGYIPGLDEDSGGTTTPGFIPAPADPIDPAKLPPTTNEEWVRRVSERLIETYTYDPQMVASTLGKYLSRQGLTVAEQDLVRIAWSLEGRPPVGDYPIIALPSQPPPSTAPPADTGPIFDTVLAGWKVDQWVRDVQRVHQLPEFSWDRAVQLNPAIVSNVDWPAGSGRTGNTEDNRFIRQAVYRLR